MPSTRYAQDNAAANYDFYNAYPAKRAAAATDIYALRYCVLTDDLYFVAPTELTIQESFTYCGPHDTDHFC